VVPAFTGLGAPYWDPNARGTIVGLTRGTGRAHLIRATLESIAQQTCDVVEAMGEAGGEIRTLRVDGGASANDFLMQFQADLLGLPVERAAVRETTALGAAYLAGIGCGLWTPSDLQRLWRADRIFEPRMSDDRRGFLRSEWRRAVERSRGWASPL
jgi:glycerol kinase